MNRNLKFILGNLASIVTITRHRKSHLATGILTWSLGVVVMLISFPMDSYRNYSLAGNTNSSTLTLGSHPNLCSILSKKWGSISGEIEAKVVRLRGYQNLFQTDNGNHGIRVEITELGVIALIVSSPVESEFGKFSYAVANGTVTENRTFHIFYQVSFDGTLTIRLDKERPRSVYANINPRCNKVILGSGFENSRKFLGNAKITIVGTERSTVPVPRITEGIAVTLQILGFVLILKCLRNDCLSPSNRNIKP